MTLKKSPQPLTQLLLTSFRGFKEVYPTLRDIFILLAALITFGYGVLATPEREAIRKFGGAVEALEDTYHSHAEGNTKAFNELKQSIEKLNASITGPQRDSINSRLSRIEGELGR